MTVAQKFDKYNLQLYGGFRHYDLDRPGEALQDIDLFMIGALMFYDGMSGF